MALVWAWQDKCGELQYQYYQDGKWIDADLVTLYEGNALLIMLHEKKKTYTMWSFWADERHMKSMLGLDPKDKEHRNEYNTDGIRWKKIRLNKKRCKVNKIVPALIKAFDDLDIEIYSEA